jgi:hypothetical protein
VRIATLIAVILAFGTAPATSIGVRPEPALRMVDPDPLTLLGAGFKPRERVVVTARGDMPPVRVRVIASHAGRFRATLNTAFDPCTGPEVIRAAGVKGSTALLKLSLRECPGIVLEQ